MSERYSLARDDDGHWYVVPVSQREAFSKWLDGVNDEDFDPNDYPPGVVAVGGSYSLVTFPSFEVRD